MRYEDIRSKTLDEVAPLLISREGLHVLAENIINGANTPPYLRLIDPFLETRECSLCHRRFDEGALKRGVCFICSMRVRGTLTISKQICKQCTGEN